LPERAVLAYEKLEAAANIHRSPSNAVAPDKGRRVKVEEVVEYPVMNPEIDTRLLAKAMVQMVIDRLRERPKP